MHQYSLFDQIERQDSIVDLNFRIINCKKCNLAASRKNALTGEGPVDARIMFVALAPGYKEDIQNKMFVGPSGQVFNSLLSAAGIARSRVYMTNLIKCKLPNNRKPDKQEVECCSNFIKQEIAIVQPEIIAPLGYVATKAIMINFNAENLFMRTQFRNINGEILNISGQQIMPLTHPSALLYNPSLEADTIRKFQKLKAEYY